MAERFEVFDLFAGPGGLGEGFAAAGRRHAPNVELKIRLSVEKESTEVQTLRLRAFLRSFPDEFPQAYYDALNDGRQLPDFSDSFPAEWRKACDEVRQLCLGTEEAWEELRPIIDRSRESCHGNTILIGGPPCQAYSLVGRARNAGIKGYVPERDERHFLYREYVRILDRLRPAAFVMENVKGMLSSEVDGGPIFQRVLEDLSVAGDGYTLVPLAAISGALFPEASDFVVRSEEYGVPQCRHRVFVVGVRSDIRPPALGGRLLRARSRQEVVGAALSDLPMVRSGLSSHDDADSWREAVREEGRKILKWAPGELLDVAEEVGHALREVEHAPAERSATTYRDGGPLVADDLRRWLRDERLHRVLHHETRGHRQDDLGRYLFAAAFAKARGRSPKLSDFPDFLLPAHRNRHDGKFEDRFRVQMMDRPATTITSHISKDGHYYIHPDPVQVRSFTVREAARLQTFPDNYFFFGRRTAQYHQIGNAVPPFLACQIADVLIRLLLGSTARSVSAASEEELV